MYGGGECETSSDSQCLFVCNLCSVIIIKTVIVVIIIIIMQYMPEHFRYFESSYVYIQEIYGPL